MYTAIIPVRKGSRRLQNKNISPFAGKNLLTYKISQLQKVSRIDEVIVSSDCDDMLLMASNLGVVTHKRTLEFCDEVTQPFGAVVAHIAETARGSNIIWAPCTSPLVEPEDYLAAIVAYENNVPEYFDSLVSVETLRRYLWAEGRPLNYSLGLAHVPSQDLAAYQRITDGIVIASKEKMIEWSYFHGKNPFLFEVSKRAAVDIDDVYDLECARAWLNMR
jgi:CMP-N,N'-diacetyllegionaminic acid synthase